MSEAETVAILVVNRMPETPPSNFYILPTATLPDGTPVQVRTDALSTSLYFIFGAEGTGYRVAVRDLIDAVADARKGLADVP